MQIIQITQTAQMTQIAQITDEMHSPHHLARYRLGL